MRRAAAAVLVLALAGAGVAGAAVGDVAARQPVKPAHGGVFTNEDLAAAHERAAAERAGAETQGPGGAEPIAAAAAAEKPFPERVTRGAEPAAAKPIASADGAAARAALEARWRERFKDARVQRAVAEAGSWRESYRTTNYKGVKLRFRVWQQVDTPELQQAREALAALEDELRRSGLPAEWAAEP